MTHWVVMGVIHQYLQLLLSLDSVLPEPALPDVALSMSVPRLADAEAGDTSARERACEQCLHSPDAPRIVRVTPGQRPEEVGVVRHDDRREEAGGSFAHHLLERPSQPLHVVWPVQDWLTPVSDDRQEDGAPRRGRAAVVGQRATLRSSDLMRWAMPTLLDLIHNFDVDGPLLVLRTC